ncbi:MAG TPA: chromate transporter [Bacillota bacterium]|nr:chromate transporter [Bacillota bacterium]HOR86873.1 chromate transporter [Bacillota bacterium]HPL53450.1 chromate transporter [Bacillota bacterium]
MIALIKLFLTFLKVGAFSFGGGYAVLSLIQKEVIEGNGWISAKDFIDIVAIAEMTPGPIAVNSSTYVGYKVGSLAGSAVATFGVVLAPITISLLVSVYYNKFKHLEQVTWIIRGIRPAVLGLIAAACIKIGKASIADIRGALIALLAFAGVYKLKLNPIIVILISGALGVILYGIM